MVSSGMALCAVWFGQSRAPGAVPPSSPVQSSAQRCCSETRRAEVAHGTTASTAAWSRATSWFWWQDGNATSQLPPHHAQCRWQCHHGPAVGTDHHQHLAIRAQHQLWIPGLHVTAHTCLHARLFLIDTACSPPILPAPQLAQLPCLNYGADKGEGVNCAYFLGAGRTQPSCLLSIPPPSSAGSIGTNPSCCPSEPSSSPKHPMAASPKPWAGGIALLPRPRRAIGMLQLTSLQPDPLSRTEPLFVSAAAASAAVNSSRPNSHGHRAGDERCTGVAAQLPAWKEPSANPQNPVQGAVLPYCPTGTLLGAASPDSAFLPTIPSRVITRQVSP